MAGNDESDDVPQPPSPTGHLDELASLYNSGDFNLSTKPSSLFIDAAIFLCHDRLLICDLEYLNLWTNLVGTLWYY